MSTTQPPPAPPAQKHAPNQVKIYSHSSLFYWWPVWAVGFILGLLTLTEKTRMVVVPADAEAKRHWKVETEQAKTETRGGTTVLIKSAKIEDREGVLLKPSDDPKKHLTPRDNLEQDPQLKLHTTTR